MTVFPHNIKHLDPTGEVFADGATRTSATSSAGVRAILVAGVAFELISAIWLAWLNPVQGYDENWYIINAYRYQGVTSLPFAHHRPPLLPLLIALVGPYRWLIPAISHIGAATVLYLLLRRLVTPALAMFGGLLFIACGQLRMSSVVLLTETPTIFLLLLAVYALACRRSLLVGVAVGLAVMTHWSFATAVPVIVALYTLRHDWAANVRFVAGLAAVGLPFAVGYALAYGDPLGPGLANLVVQQQGTNDWWYYLREFPQVPLALIVGAVVACVWLARADGREDSRTARDVGWLLVGLIGARLVLLHLVVPKESRFLVPLVPLLIVLSLLAVCRLTNPRALVRAVVCVALFVSVLPNKGFFYYLHDLQNDPAALIAELAPSVRRFSRGEAEMVYSDANDLAVMGHTGRAAVAVTGEGSWHHSLLSRLSASRDEIPHDGLYLTWNPAHAKVLAVSSASTHGRLHLVRWDARAEVLGTLAHYSRGETIRATPAKSVPLR